MKTRYFALIMGILLMGCSAPAAAIELAAPTETATPLPPPETPVKTTVTLAGVRGMKASGDSLWAWSENEIWRYKEGDWSFYAFVPGSSDHMAYLSDKLWAVENNRLLYFDGEQWQEISGPIMGAYSIKADDDSGILWVSTGENLYRWDVEQMSYIAHPRVPCCYLFELEVTGDGTVWAGGLYGYLPWVGGLARYDEASGTWEMVRPWRAEEDVTPQLLASTPNGDLWVKLVDWSEDWEVLQEAGEPFVEWALAYWDSASGEWTVFEQDLPEGYPFKMAVDDKGVWLAQGSGFVEQMEFNGLARFDGENWSHYLPGTNVFDVAVAPDGTIWYTTGDDDMLRQLR